MGAVPMTDGISIPSSTELADERTHLALTRTLVALDRTLMAWIRTAASLISFGFSIYKFFQTLRESQPAQEAHLIGSRGFGMVMIVLGIGSLLFATHEYRTQVKLLYLAYGRYGPFRPSLTAGVASTVAGLGILGFILVLLHQ
jgi:inner membrane protein YidH